jgi:sodium/potassium-transporting ATPase subunit alpha
LVTDRLIYYAYALIGVCQFSAGLFTYFVVMHDYGFHPGGLIMLTGAEWDRIGSDKEVDGKHGEKTFQDIWDGRTNTGVTWVFATEADVHLPGRVGLTGEATKDKLEAVDFGQRSSGELFTWTDFQTYCEGKKGATALDSAVKESFQKIIDDKNGGVKTGVTFRQDDLGRPLCEKKSSDGAFIPFAVWTPDGQDQMDGATKDQECQFDSKSSVNFVADENDEPTDRGVPLCFTTEALKAAQTSYLIAIIIVQFSNLWFCKTRKLALWQQGLGNTFQNLSILSEFSLGLLIVYAQPINVGFQTRSLEGWHFAVPGMPFAVFEYVFDEIRKAQVRVGDEDAANRFGSTLTKTGKWVYDRTYY